MNIVASDALPINFSAIGWEQCWHLLLRGALIVLFFLHSRGTNVHTLSILPALRTYGSNHLDEHKGKPSSHQLVEGAARDHARGQSFHFSLCHLLCCCM
jgi:hypothetical protein